MKCGKLYGVRSMKKPTDERMKEFVRYHTKGDGECNGIILKVWADMNRLSGEERFDLSYFFSVTYCVESGIILFKNKEEIKRNPVKKAEELKKYMIFQSDRKYVKMKNRFEVMLSDWADENIKKNITFFPVNGFMDLDSAVKEVESWNMFGRFSAFLFLETLATLLGCPITNTTIDWKNGNTATSGLLNLFGMDEEAKVFDSQQKLPFSYEIMDQMLQETINAVEAQNGDGNVTKIETSLCAYRKLYKGSRYNGFYLDRMLSELVYYRKFLEFDKITDELFDIRKRCFKHAFLGEVGGWCGIRNEMKKKYILTGNI